MPADNIPLQVLAGLLDAWVEERPQFDWLRRVVFTPDGEVLPLDPAARPPFYLGIHDNAVHRGGSTPFDRLELELNDRLRQLGVDRWLR